MTREPLDNGFGQFDDHQQENIYTKLHKRVFDRDEPDIVIKEIQKAIKNFPDKPIFYNLLQCAYVVAGWNDESDKQILETYQHFPGYLFGKVAYANLLIDQEKFDQVPAVFNGQPDLNYIYPERNVFHVTEAAAFYGTFCRYFLSVGNIDSADLYMNAILKNDLANLPGQTIMQTVVREFVKIKMDKLEEANKAKLE